MVDNDGNWKLADFSRPINDQELETMENLTWLAPEVNTIEDFTIKSDIYSLAILIGDLLLAELSPDCSDFFDWKNTTRYFIAHKKELRPFTNNPPKELPDFMISMLQNSWSHNPNLRLPIKKIQENLFEFSQ